MTWKLDIPPVLGSGSLPRTDKAKTTVQCLSCAYKPGSHCNTKPEQGYSACKCLHIWTEDNRMAQKKKAVQSISGTVWVCVVGSSHDVVAVQSKVCIF